MVSPEPFPLNRKRSFQARLFLRPGSGLAQPKRARVLFLFPIGWTAEPPATCEGCTAPLLRRV